MGERPLRLQKLKQQKMGCEEEVTLLRARISSLQHEFAEEQAAKEEIAQRQSTEELEILAEKNLQIMDLEESLWITTIERDGEAQSCKRRLVEYFVIKQTPYLRHAGRDICTRLQIWLSHRL